MFDSDFRETSALQSDRSHGSFLQLPSVKRLFPIEPRLEDGFCIVNVLSR